METFDWKQVKDRYYSKPVSYTKNRKPFRVCRITESALYIDLPCGEQSVSRVHLEKAVRLISQGAIIGGPSDYKQLVYDERPAYAWAILRDLKFIQ
ncbi:MAG: hypothetical protein NWE93_06640 [Candidatus Bathyarchaeota archaeon]|nr:hypothetical protein [Candidatus Bathyarchaeota archaeon]